MGSRYDGVCLRQPGIGRSHGPVRPSCLGRARGNRVAEARGGSCGGMAGAAGGDEATVSREMAGNSFAVGSGRCHRASTAQRGRESRRVSCVRPGGLDGERGAGLVRRLVVREHRSPGRIAGGIAVERPGVFCQVVIGQCGVSFPSEKAVGFSPVRNWPVIARVLLFHCIRA